jgi:hypothetical protein
MSNSSYAFNLIVASQLFYSYCTYINFGLGLIGNLLNILVFTNLKMFRHNRCAFYLIVESIVDIPQLTQVFVNEIWKLSINGMDPTNIFPVWCKLSNMVRQWCRLMLSSIVCFVAIDQFLCTNHAVYLQQLSSLKLARRQICIATLLCLLHTILYGVFLEINPLSGCVLTNTGVINVRRIVRRQIPIHRRRLDQQLTAMIFARVIFFVLLQLPYTIYRICTLRSIIVQANTFEYATMTWAQVTSTALVYFSHAVIISF